MKPKKPKKPFVVTEAGVRFWMREVFIDPRATGLNPRFAQWANRHMRALTNGQAGIDLGKIREQVLAERREK